jgi:hypothetical protein
MTGHDNPRNLGTIGDSLLCNKKQNSKIVSIFIQQIKFTIIPKNKKKAL